MTGTNTPDLRALVERLEATKTQHRVDMLFGGCIGIPDESETREVLINPDGPAAAAALTTLQHQLAEMEAALGVWLAIDEKLTGGDAVGQIEWQQASTQSRSTLKDRGEGR